MNKDLVYRLRKRAEIRRQNTERKSVQENRPDRISDLLEEAANEIERLKRDFNVALADNIDDFNAGDTAVIRTHGIPKQELEVLYNKNVNIVDATCPYVTKPQQICEEMSAQGYDIVIFGDETHPEIKGVKSYASGNVYVINSVEEVAALKLRDKVATVAQTTRKIDDYQQIIFNLMKNFDIEIFIEEEELIAGIDEKKKTLKKLYFTKQKEYIVDNILLDSPIEYKNDIDESYSEYYFELTVDDEIEIPPQAQEKFVRRSTSSAKGALGTDC